MIAMRSRFVRPLAGGRPVAAWAPMAVAMTALLCVYGAWQLSGWPAGARSTVADAVFVPIGLAAVGSIVCAARRTRAQPRLSAAWWLLAAGGMLYLGGQIAQSAYELADGSLPFPSVADLLYLAFYPVVLAGLLHASAGRAGAGERVRVGLDLAIVAVGAAAVMMYVILGPTAIRSGPNAFRTAVSVAYPVADVVLLVGLAAVLMRPTAPSSALAFRFMTVGLLFFVAADVIYNEQQLHFAYHAGDPVDALWMIAVALFAVAGAAQPAPAPHEVPLAAGRPAASRLPNVAIAVGFGLLLVSSRHDALLPDGFIVILSVALAALVSVRQLLAQRDLVAAHDALARQALRDALTGLPNRALVIDRAAQMLARARRSGTPIAALYVDIDHFKAVNDRHGHAAGDDLLRAASMRLSDCVRDTDTVGRIGGDEFVVLLEEPSVVAPELVAERICAALRAPFELAHVDGAPPRVSASVGLAFGLEQTVDGLLHDADLALYDAKRGGRDRWRPRPLGLARARARARDGIAHS